ncbi:virB8 family protein [Thaumasiovibrio subtropicus]|uniref:virB8 family protein n=1 Tax=Thaumasiovibrio subtropicus TaxID=1891207 RepID=UPI000B35A3AC|nr:type IV secretion system protein [Thaumasiovibrio subtropicus]
MSDVMIDSSPHIGELPEVSEKNVYEKNLNSLKKEKEAELNKAAEIYLKEASDFHKDSVDMQKSKAKYALFAAIGAFLLSILSVTALVIALPFKTVVPYVITVDNNTGQTQTALAMSDAKKTTYGEALDKYWLNQYVIQRNTYDWYTIQSGYDFVNLTSTTKVMAAYANFISSDNSPVKVFGENRSIEIKTDGVSFLPSSSDTNVAQVRFTRTIRDRNGRESATFKPTQWIATITWEYTKELKYENERLINPLQFIVTSYRESEILK